MIKKILFVLTVFVFVFTTVGLSLAIEKGNKRKGKYTYRKVVKACYQRGAVDSDTPQVSPSSKKMAEWKAVFEGRDLAQFGCQEEWDNLSEKDYLDIYSYFYHYAADSATPATCK
ncbi:MAG: cytochrome c family protein [Desulfobacterales bacterium]|nr:cytochrome c family protein [Desulfobacterales bacterium]